MFDRLTERLGDVFGRLTRRGALGEADVDVARAKDVWTKWRPHLRVVATPDVIPAEARKAPPSDIPTAVLALTKRALDAAATNPLDRQLDLERDLQAEAGASPDHREGVRAFLDKRPPVFTGRPR